MAFWLIALQQNLLLHKSSSKEGKLIIDRVFPENVGVKCAYHFNGKETIIETVLTPEETQAFRLLEREINNRLISELETTFINGNAENPLENKEHENSNNFE